MNKEYELFGRKVTGEVLLFGSLLILSVVVVLGVIIPQFQELGIQTEKNGIKEAEVMALQSSLNAINSVSEERLASDVEILTTALPTNKEVISVFSSIVSLATDVGIQVRGFTIQVGDVYDTKNEQPHAEISSETGFPSMDVVLSLSSASQSQIVEFTKRLYASFPIAKVNTVTAQDGNSSMEISFYYRSYDLDALQNTREVPGYTQETLQMLEALRNSQN